MLLGVTRISKAVLGSGLLPSDSHAYSQMVAAAGVLLKAAFMLAVGFSLSWSFLPERASLCGQTPHSIGSGFQEGGGPGRLPGCEGFGARNWCGLSYRYSIGQALSETRFKER